MGGGEQSQSGHGIRGCPHPSDGDQEGSGPLTLDGHRLHLHHRGHFLHAHMVAPPLPKPGESGRKEVGQRAAAVSARVRVTQDRSGASPHNQDEGEDGCQDDHQEQDQHDDQTQVAFFLHRNN